MQKYFFLFLCCCQCLYCDRHQTLIFGSVKRSQIEAVAFRSTKLFPEGKSEEEDRFGKVAASQKSKFDADRSIFGAVEDKLAFVLERLPEWSAESAKVKQATQGATNYGYIVKYKSDSGFKHRYFIRIQTENRETASSNITNEILCQTIAAEYDIAPEIILSFPEMGIIVSRLIRNKKNEVDINNPETLKRGLALIKSIHELPVPFPQSVNPFDLIDDLAGKAASYGCEFPEKWNAVAVPALENMKRVCYDRCQSVPCHLDLSPQNLLNDGKRIWVIDWEYSANCDPFFDLGTLASVTFLDDAGLKRIFCGYLGDDRMEMYSHFYQMAILADLRWYLWCLLQDKTSPLECPYEEWAECFLQNSLKRIEKLLDR